MDTVDEDRAINEALAVGASQVGGDRGGEQMTNDIWMAGTRTRLRVPKRGQAWQHQEGRRLEALATEVAAACRTLSPSFAS